MMFQNSFGKTVDLLHKAMDVSSLRRDAIANNIANAEVPGFKRSVVNFESELKKALDSETSAPALAMATSDPRHMGNDGFYDWHTVQPTRVLDYTSQSKANGNNVDAEEEMTLSLQNQMSYTLEAQAVGFEFSQVNLVLR